MLVIPRTQKELQELADKAEQSVSIPPSSKLHLMQVNGATILSTSLDPFKSKIKDQDQNQNKEQ